MTTTPTPTGIHPIETRYAGCRFRSRLEARWAVFFNHLDITWEYESQGFELNNGRRYLPDFLLSDCGTWVEVKGHDAALDVRLMEDAARELPDMPFKHEAGPKLLILGPIPDATTATTDFTWLGLEPAYPMDHLLRITGDQRTDLAEYRYGFGSYAKNDRPWLCGDQDPLAEGDRVTPYVHRSEHLPTRVRNAYVAARSARFEHGESGVDTR